MTLLVLPNELLLAIAEILPQPSINALARTNCRCYDLLNPVLYAYNVQTHHGDALHWAASHGQPEAAWKSLRQGANVESEDHKTKFRPLMQAARLGYADVVALLVAHGADVHAKDTNSSRDAITWAVLRNNTDVVRILLDHGVDPNSQDMKGYKFLHIAAQEYAQSRESLTRLLVSKGADVEADIHRHPSITPLHVACISNSVEVARCLIECGAKFDKRMPRGKTFLHLAASRGHVKIVELLLEKGANVAWMNNEGYTPFHIACYHGRLPVAMLLLGHGADIEATTFQGNTPLHLGVLWEVNVFKGLESNPDAITSFLLEQGANPNVENESGIAPLHAAIGEEALCKLLLHHGANPEPRTGFGTTPLHMVASGGSIESARQLLQRGADVQPMDADGNTPLHLAARKYFPALVELLLDAGADRLIKNKKGQLPIHLAVEETVGKSRAKQAKLEQVLNLLESHLNAGCK